MPLARSCLMMSFALLALTSCSSTPSGFIECIDDSNCGLASGGKCLANPDSGHQFCAYPDLACAGGMRWSDLDVEASVSGACIVPPSPDDGGTVDATLPGCVALGCNSIGIFCSPSGCTCTPPGGPEMVCYDDRSAVDASVDAQPDGSGDGGLPTCEALGCSPVGVFCQASGECVCTPPGGQETACVR